MTGSRSKKNFITGGLYRVSKNRLKKLQGPLSSVGAGLATGIAQREPEDGSQAAALAGE